MINRDNQFDAHQTPEALGRAAADFDHTADELLEPEYVVGEWQEYFEGEGYEIELDEAEWARFRDAYIAKAGELDSDKTSR